MSKKPKAKRIGDLQLVPNTQRKFGSDREYFFVRLQYPNGEESAHLFTRNQVNSAYERATRNPEDLLAAGIIRDLID